jgi:hypothetical protein
VKSGMKAAGYEYVVIDGGWERNIVDMLESNKRDIAVDSWVARYAATSGHPGRQSATGYLCPASAEQRQSCAHCLPHGVNCCRQ